MPIFWRLLPKGKSFKGYFTNVGYTHNASASWSFHFQHHTRDSVCSSVFSFKRMFSFENQRLIFLFVKIEPRFYVSLRFLIPPWQRICLVSYWHYYFHNTVKNFVSPQYVQKVVTSTINLFCVVEGSRFNGIWARRAKIFDVFSMIFTDFLFQQDYWKRWQEEVLMRRAFCKASFSFWGQEFLW